MSRKRMIPFLLAAILLLKVEYVLPQKTLADNYQYLSPKPGTSGHNPETEITIRFGEKIEKSSIDEEVILVVGNISGQHKGLLSLTKDLQTLTFKPETFFSFNEKVTIYFKAGIETVSGILLPGVDFCFYIKENLAGNFQNEGDNILINNKSVSKPDANKINKSGPLSFNDMLISDILTKNMPAPGNIFTTVAGNPGHFIYVFNNNGIPIYVKKFPYQIFNLKPQPNGSLTYYDFNVEGYVAFDSSLKSIDTITMLNGYKAHTHELTMDDNGHIFLFAYDPQVVDMSKIAEGGNQFATVSGLVIQELDKEKNLIFQWRSWDYFNIADSYADLLRSTVDYVHGNSLDADSDTTLILTSRNMSEITKINRLNGNIIWRLGGKKNEFTFTNDSRGFSMPHSTVKSKNGNLILFDNGVGKDPSYSRGIEYEMNEEEKKVTLIHEYRHSPDIYTDIKGNIQRMDNGNTLVFWGHSPYITEFDESNNITFDVTFDKDLFPTYRSFRFDWRPGLFTFSTDTLNYKEVNQGDIETRSFDVINQSDASISITSINNKNGNFFVTDPLPVEISSGGRQTINVAFQSTKGGPILDTLNVCYESDSILVNRQIIAIVESIPETGIEKLSKSDITVYPNPGNGIYQIKFSDEGTFMIRVIDVFGKIILEDIIEGNYLYSFNIADKPDGLYLVEIRVSDNDIPYVLKIIKKSQ